MLGSATRRHVPSFAIPMALATTGTLEYVFEDVGAPPRETLPFLYLAVGVLLVRRAIPFASPVGALAVLTVESFIIGGRVVVDPATTLFLGFYCLFVLAAHSEESRAAIGAVLGLVAFALITSNTPGSDALWTLFVCALLLVGWGCGLVYGRHERHASQLERRGEQLRADAANAVASERARIAREIHDIVSHSVSVIVVQARGGRRVLDDAPDDARQAFDSIETAGEQALVELRRLLGIIRDDAEQPALAPQPGLGGLDALLTQVRDAGLPVALAVEGPPTPLPAGVDLAAYRVIQEGLTNALKHAGDARASVIVRYGLHSVAVEVSDDGNGVASGRSGGRGLVGMRERVGIYGGTLHSGNRPGGGFVLSVLLPLAAGSR